MDHHKLYSVRRYFSVCFVQALIFLSVFSVSAVYEVSEDTFVFSGPLPVYIVEPDTVVTSDLFAGSDGFPFYGSSWAKGSASGLGSVQLFFPIDHKQDVGLDSSGRLFNISDQSWNGVMYDGSGSAYTVYFEPFNLPEYRYRDGSSWEYQTLYFEVSESNLVLFDSPSPVYSLYDVLPWLSLLLIGGVFLCSMRRS